MNVSTGREWPRFWYPLQVTPAFDDAGYLEDPERAALWRSPNPDLVRFEAIRGRAILGLLGDPGSGKSYALRAEEARVREEMGPDSTRAFDLKVYGDESRFIRDVFESEWIRAGGERHLFIDSLDEGLIRLETLGAIIVEQLQRVISPGLHVRIACRTAEWPLSLDRGLARLEGADYGAFVLAPLRRRDVVVAAGDAGIDVDTFTTWVERIPAVSLAIKPLTLDLLLRTLDRVGPTASQVDLYDRGCRYLLEELDLERRERRVSSATPSARYFAAQFCAAALIFGGRAAIWRDADLGEVPEEDLKLTDVAQHLATLAPGLDPELVSDILKTPLFTTRARLERIAFAHQTYAEFLAARFLADRNLPLRQALEVLTHGGAQAVVPQLRETAAWLAQMRPDVFDALLALDPVVLLRSNVAAAEVTRRKDLVDALLRLYAEGRLFDDWDARRYYDLLAHPGLVEQLRPILQDKNAPTPVRSGAVALADRNTKSELEEELLAIALDGGAPLQLRIDAAHALASKATDAVRLRMRPLLHDPADQDRQLRGYALRALWPKHLSAKELFDELGPEGNLRLFGAYQMFVLSELVPALKDDDIVHGLRWICERVAHGRGMPHHYDQLADQIVIRAASLIDTPDVRQAITNALLARQGHEHRLLADHKHWPVFDDPVLRRAVVTTAVAGAVDAPNLAFALAYAEPPLVRIEDRLWYIEQALASPDPETVGRWTQILIFTLMPADERFYVALFDAMERQPVLEKELRPYFLVALDGQRARIERDTHERQRLRERQLAVPSPAERVRAVLSQIEGGDISRWWVLHRELTLEPDSARYDFHRLFQPDLRQYVGWKALDEETRQRIIAAARGVILEHRPGPTDWLGSDRFMEADLAGYRAFVLLLAEDRPFIETLSPDVWRRWAVVMAGYPIMGDADVAHLELLTFALPHATDELARAFEVLLEKDCRRHEHPFVLRSMPEVREGPIAEMLMGYVGKRSARPKCVGSVLEHLLRLGHAGARTWALAHLRRPGKPNTRQRGIAVHAGRAVLAGGIGNSWPTLWGAIQRTQDYGRDLFLEIAHTWDEQSWLPTLSEREHADLYLWLELNFPYENDPELSGAVPPRAEVGRLRDRVIQRLANFGTGASVAELRRVRAALPGSHYAWIDRMIMSAADVVLARSWTPPTIATFTDLVRDQQRHLVGSGRSLMDAVLESLDRLRAELHGETPAVVDLWNSTKQDLRPKDEVALSNYVKRWLKKDLAARGVVVNREVEIRDVRAAGRGQLLDLRVDAVARDASDELDIVSVFVEVKASWSPDLLSGMSRQLVGRYLKDAGARHGIYLVGWFASSRWSRTDRRRRASERSSPDEIAGALSSEAEGLSGEHLQIVPFVMDASLHDSEALARPRRKGRATRRTRRQAGGKRKRQATRA